MLLCHGGEHQLRFFPQPDNPWINQRVRLENTLQATFVPPPGDYQVFGAEALWTVTLPADGGDTEAVLTLFNEFTAQPYPMTVSTGHYRLTFSQTIQPPGPIVLGEDIVGLAVRARSFYIQDKYTQDAEIEWLVDGHATNLPTGADGWCKYDFKPERIGNTSVKAKMWSPYDNQFIEHEFSFEVLETSPWASDLQFSYIDEPFTVGEGFFARRDTNRKFRIDPKNTKLIGSYFSAVPLNHIIHNEPFKRPKQLTEAGIEWLISTTGTHVKSALLWTCEPPGKPVMKRTIPMLSVADDLHLAGLFTFDGTASFQDLPVTRNKVHSFKFKPNPDNPLNGITLTLECSASAGVIFSPAPGQPVLITEDEIEWTIDARNANPGQNVTIQFYIRCPKVLFPRFQRIILPAS